MWGCRRKVLAVYLILGKESLILEWLQVEFKEAAQILKAKRRVSLTYISKITSWFQQPRQQQLQRLPLGKVTSVLLKFLTFRAVVIAHLIQRLGPPYCHLLAFTSPLYSVSTHSE